MANAEVADMCTMGGSPINGGIPFGKVTDVHTMNKLPMNPSHPAVVHGTGMAGDVIGAPANWPMSQMR